MTNKNRFTTFIMVVALLVTTTLSVSADNGFLVEDTINDDNYYQITGQETLIHNDVNTLTIPYRDDMESIEHISMLNTYTRKNEPLEYTLNYNNKSDIQIELKAVNGLMADTLYEIKLFTKDKRYLLEIKTEKHINFENYEVDIADFFDEFGNNHRFPFRTVLIEANPKKGFNFPYYLHIPCNEDGTYTSSIYGKNLIVEMNNTGYIDSLTYPKLKISHKFESFTRRRFNMISRLEAPFMTPAFPRFNTNIYTHLLDRETIEFTQEEFDKFGMYGVADLEKQLLAMTKDAKEQFKANGIVLKEKFSMIGFSASGKFANRFSMIYPEYIDTIVAGTVPTATMLPLSTYKDETLNFPLGVADYEKLFGKEFNLKAYQDIKQFLYVGEDDTNEILNFRDSFSKEDASQFRRLLGETMPERWKSTATILKDVAPNVLVHVYKDIGHRTTDTTNADALKFLKANLNSDTLVPIDVSKSGK